MATKHEPGEDTRNTPDTGTGSADTSTADQPTRAERLRGADVTDADARSADRTSVDPATRNEAIGTTRDTDASTRATTPRDDTTRGVAGRDDTTGTTRDTDGTTTARTTREEEVAATRSSDPSTAQVRTLDREARLRKDAADQRRASAFELAKARTTNRVSTDFGLLLLRVLPVIMVLHGVAKARGFAGFRDGVAQNSFGALAPDVFALMVTAGQIALPILIAVGFLTRLSALLMTVMMGFIWVVTQLPQGLIDGRTGGLVGEAALTFAMLALPLVFTGAGRFSIDHAMFGGRANARAERRAEKALN